MSVTEAERRRCRWRRSASLLFLLVAAPAGASLLHGEDLLASQAAVPAATRRLAFASTYFGADYWAGHRHLLRMAGSRGDQVQWSLTLPWLYSSLGNGGRSGRDNLLMGGSLRLAGRADDRLRLGGEFWLPLAAESLAPLAERRACGRLSLLVETAAAGGVEAGLAYGWELRGIGPEPEDGPWPSAWSLDWRLGGRPLSGLRPALMGGGSWQPESEAAWGWAGAGFGLAWDARWLVELTGGAYVGAAGDRARPDYRIRLELRRDVKVAAPPGAPAPDAPASEGAAGPRP